MPNIFYLQKIDRSFECLKCLELCTSVEKYIYNFKVSQTLYDPSLKGVFNSTFQNSKAFYINANLPGNMQAKSIGFFGFFWWIKNSFKDLKSRVSRSGSKPEILGRRSKHDWFQNSRTLEKLGRHCFCFKAFLSENLLLLLTLMCIHKSEFNARKINK